MNAIIHTMNNKSSNMNSAAIAAGLAVVFFAVGTTVTNKSTILSSVAFAAGLLLISYAGYLYSNHNKK